MATRYRSIGVIALFCSVFLTALMMWGYGSSHAGASPIIDRDQTILKPGKKELVIVGENFEPGIFVQTETANGIMAQGQIDLQSSNMIVIHGVSKDNFPDGVATITLRNPGGDEVKETLAVIPSAIGPSPLDVSDIQRIIGQAAAAALKFNAPATIGILDREGNVLALYQMKGAPKIVVVRDLGLQGAGLEGLGGPQGVDAKDTNGVVPSVAAVISKAGVGAFFGTQGNAFSTRTAAYIIREHIPPFIKNMPGGPLFGVQVSSLGCSDVKQPGLPLGLSGDPGGIPIYKNGIMAGGIGIEMNGQYTVALNRPEDFGRKFDTSSDIFSREIMEEMVAHAAVRGYEAPDAITGDKILVNGIRLPYRANFDIPDVQAIPFNQIPGKLLKIPETGKAEIRTGVQTEFRDIKLRDRDVRVVNRFFPFKNGSTLTASEAEQMLFDATKEANRVRAAIRRPIEVPAEVNITVIDATGKVLGIVSTPDAPVFGFDVSSEKARAAVFFSRSDALDILNKIGLGKYSDRFLAEEFPIGSLMLTDRSVGWIHRPFYPDGIEDNQVQGAPILSSEPKDFSPLNNGFQTDYLLQGRQGSDPLSIVIGRSIVNVITGKRGNAAQHFCDASNGKVGDILNSTLMIFSGGDPVFKNGKLVGAVGISGDGIDQDNIIAAFGALSLAVPLNKRIDQFFYRGTRVPFDKFPRHPHLGEE